MAVRGVEHADGGDETLAEGRKPHACDLLIRNAYVLTLDANRTVYPRGAVAIDGPTIVAVGPEREVLSRFRPRRTLDARSAPVHPGFVDAHTHLTFHLTRGVFSDVPRFSSTAVTYTDWFNALEPEDEYASALLACLEMLRCGITCVMEPGTVFEPDAAAAAIEAIGMRGSLGDPFLWDVDSFLALSAHLTRAPASTHRALRLLGQQLPRNRSANALVRGHVAVYGGVTASDELELAASVCARDNGCALTQHQSARIPEAEADDKRFGCHPLVHYAEIGVLGPHCTFVHMNIIRDDEIQPVRDSGLSIVWCAVNAMNWGNGTGIPYRGRIPELHQQGTTVTLGSDTGKFGMDQQAFVGYLLGRDRSGDPLEAEDVLEMATLGGAKAMCLADQIGSLEPGKRADVVIRSNDLPEAQPGVNIAQSIVLSGRAKSVNTVLVDGRIVLKQGRSVLVDDGVVYELAQASAKRMMERTGIRVQPRWPVVE